MVSSDDGFAGAVAHFARHLLSEAVAGAGTNGTAGDEEVVDPGIIATLIAWQVAILFLGFVTITIVWEFCIALLTFLTVCYTGRKALWVTRLKDEILALGVITLTLVVIEASLAYICIDGYEHTYSHEEFPDHHCPEGQHLLFTRWRILQTHLLLFAVAVVFILYACTSLYICIFRLRFWRKWELQAKVGAATDVGAPIIFRRLTKSGLAHGLRMGFWNSWYSHIHQETYTMLRLVFRLRMDAANLADPLPRQANFLNIVEQAMEVNFAEAAKYSWVLSIGMAIFLCIPIELHALYWLFGISAVIMIVCAAKLQSIVVHLSAMAYYDFHTEIRGHLSKFSEFEHQHHEMRELPASNLSHTQSTVMLLPPPNALSPQPSDPTPAAGTPEVNNNNSVSMPVFRLSEVAPAPSADARADSLDMPRHVPGPVAEGTMGAMGDNARALGSGSQQRALSRDTHHVVRVADDVVRLAAVRSAAAAADAASVPRSSGPVQHEGAASSPMGRLSRTGLLQPSVHQGTAAVPTVGSTRGGIWSGASRPHSGGHNNRIRGRSAATTTTAVVGSISSTSSSSNGAVHSLRSAPACETSPRGGVPLGESTERPLSGGGDSDELNVPLSPASGGIGVSSTSGAADGGGTAGGTGFLRAGTVRRSQVAPDNRTVGFDDGPTPASPGSPTGDEANRRVKALMAAGINSKSLQRRSFRQPPPSWWQRMWAGCCGGRGGGRRRTSSLRDPNVRPHWHVETEFDSHRHRVCGTLKDDNGKVVRNINALFWFKSPTLLLWLFQICYMENSLSLTILLYGLIRDMTGIQKEVQLGGLIALIVLDVALLIFSSTAVLPVYALINTAATSRPQALIEEIRVQKMLFDKEEYEEGIGGWLLRMLRITEAPKDEEEEEEDHQKRKVDTEFILMLADQAGVITAFGNFVAYPLKHESIYREFSATWMSQADLWHKNGKRSTTAPIVKGDMSRFRETFEWLDKDRDPEDEGSGYGITAKELSGEMRRLGTRCTIGELRDMIAEVDHDGSNEIGFQEYVLFMCFKFFDHDNDGVLDIRDIEAAMVVLDNEPKDVHEYSVMIRFIEHGNEAAGVDDGRPGGRVELDEFLRFFLDVHFEHEENPLKSSMASPDLAP